ncbi:putative Type I phosphodiesterase/nucleotide pyrophosphatase/phosphate transferase [Helianthus annuus]|nr:putative Type I phosphodiesterase/nucleotide pyrophosphatase/phosphate transferase [Helianthus annuus]
MKCTTFTLLTALAILLQITGLSLFILGFFPIKPALSGVSGPESFRPPSCASTEDQNHTPLHPHQLKSFYQKLSEIPPSYDRLILLVIDGLPAEFVLGRDGQPPSKTLKDAMPYTQSLLAGKMALGYHAKAAPPTVTLPRLKAMTSGSIGGFLDVLFNFNTQAFLEDNIIGQFFRIGWKMVMLGDETWLKLFPGLFTRHDGVSSFFVKDTVQVDHNVSRHLSYELYKDDWNLLILHYLGLDHVGHLGGRSSVMMGPKLREMDEIIKMIHLSTIQSQESDHRRTLLVVVSDHGMQENGNHGGSSYEETDSLALFIGPGISHVSPTYDTINQVDITPTLALLFGIPIPKNNAGHLIADLFHPLEDHQLLRAMELNSWQLLRLLQAQATDSTCGSLEDASSSLYLDAAALHGSWKSKNVLRSASGNDLKSTVLAYTEFLTTASDQLSHTATDKPIGLLVSGIMTMLLSCVMFMGLLYKVGQEVYPNKQVHKFQLSEALIGGIIVIIVLSMGSSSLVEEEQYLWHFMTSTFFLVLLHQTIKSNTGNRTSQLFSIAVILISGRILKGWHQGGVNWTHLPDISKSLEILGSPYVKLLQIISILLVITLCLYTLSSLRSRGSFVILIGLSYLCTGLLVLHYVIKYQGSETETETETSGNDAIVAVRLIYGLIIASVTVTVIASPWFMSFKSKDLVSVIKDSLYLSGTAYMFGWCLLQLLLQQPVNSMVISLLLVQIVATIYYASRGGSDVKQWVEIAAIYYLGMAGHFSLGNTNTLATIDVAGAFIGISSHSTVLSGVIMFVITYASPMLALLSMVMSVSVKETNMILKNREVNTGQLVKMFIGFPCLVPLGLNSVLLVAYTVILLVMRNHLFIWTVFSPKYIYVVVTTVCVLVGVLIVASTVTYVISTAVFLRKKKPAS